MLKDSFLMSSDKGKQNKFSFFTTKSGSFNVDFIILSHKGVFCVLLLNVTHSGSFSIVYLSRLPSFVYVHNNICIFISNGNIMGAHVHKSDCKWLLIQLAQSSITLLQVSENRYIIYYQNLAALKLCNQKYQYIVV